MTSVAKIILQQLGANKFAAMTGAKHFVAGDNHLIFQIPSANEGINKVKVLLNSYDTYNVAFYRQRGIKLTLVAEHKGIYVDCLQSLFTKVTGLDTHL